MTAGQPQPLQTYQELVNRLYQQSNYDFVGVALQAPVSPHLTRWLFVAGNQNERFRRIVLRRGIGIAGLVLRTGAPFWHNDILALDLSDRLYSPIARAENLQAVVAVPINDGPLHTVSGVLLAGYRSGHHRVCEADSDKLSQSLA